MNNPRKIQLIPDILSHANGLKSKKEKVEYLKTFNESPVLKNIIRIAYNKEVKWSIPEGSPPYVPADGKFAVRANSNLYLQNHKIGYLLAGSKVSQLKKESIFTRMLESMRPDESALLIAVKDKTMPYDGLTWEIFNEAFPGVLTAKPKVKKKVKAKVKQEVKDEEEVKVAKPKVKKKVKAKVKQEVKDEEVKDEEEVKVAKPKPTKKQKTSTKKKARKKVDVDAGADDADV